MEVKLDNALATVTDHEGRIRTLEANGYVSGKQLWAGLLGVAAFITGVGTLAAQLMS